ncbi:MAG: methionyl-tRNA formyltransferase [Anaerolineae bacterium]|nr:methionyl-tRNA formyltransferase [Anaerolineae bacterium]
MARVIFMGTPEFAVPSLQALMVMDDFDVVGVVTAPDRPAGRGRQLRESHVKRAAKEAGLSIYQPKTLRSEEAIKQIKSWQPDIAVVAAFGQILSPEVLDIPPHGCTNVHASLLPRWRGASPINAAIRAGDKVSGVTLMRIDPGMDTGPIIAQREIELDKRETASTLHDRLAKLGAELLTEALPGYVAGAIKPKPQPRESITHAPRLTKSEGKIDWSRPAEEIDRLVRAYDPWPGTFTRWNGKVLKVLKAHPEPSITTSEAPFPPGRVVDSDMGIAVGTGDGLLVLEEIQLEGRTPTDAESFVNGYPDFVGGILN